MPSPSKEVRQAYYLRNREKILQATADKYKNNPEKYLKYQKEYRNKNKSTINNRTKEKRQTRLLEAINLLGGKCSKCVQVFDPVCYDFHHVNPELKEFTIGENMLVGKERLYEEISKCVLLCANCHRLTHKELNNAN